MVYGPARMIGREGRSNVWLLHGGVPITINEENVRPANPGEVIAKQATELKPSRKRKRAIMSDNIPEDDVPFGDDLLLAPPDEEQEEQGAYFDLGGSKPSRGFGGGAPAAAPVNLAPAATALDPDHPETTTTPDLPPGLSAPLDAVQPIPEAAQPEQQCSSRRRPAETPLDALETEQYTPTSPLSRDAEWDDFQDLLDDLHMVGDVEADARHQSVDEPDGEHEPPPREEAVVSEVTTPTTTLSGST